MKSKFPQNAKRVFNGVIFDVWQWEQRVYDGTTKTYEGITRPDTAAVIAAIDGKILLQKEQQPHRSTSFLSLPAGKIEKGETPLQGARREFREETGYVSDNIVPWKTWDRSNKIHWSGYYFIARECTKKGDLQLDPGEKITHQLISFDTFINLSEDEKFTDIPLKYYLLQMRVHPEKLKAFRKLLFD